jgi:serine/threonine-protein phosphatase CPPED1
MKKLNRVVFIFALFVLVAIPGFAQEPFYFMMLTDPQFGAYAKDKNFVQETANFEFAVAAVNRLKPSFVIILGDMINKTGDPDQTGEFQRIFRKIDPSIPTYLLPGNHDIGNDPTPETLAFYRKNFGRDYYSFRAGPIYGIVLDTTIIVSSKNVLSDYKDQLSWLKKELETAKSSGAAQIIVFQHHPYFIADAKEADQAFNIPGDNRKQFLDLLHGYGVHYVFAGHTHKNYLVKDGDLEMIATAPVGMPFGEDGSGIRLAAVSSSGVQHCYYDFGKIPAKLKVTPQSGFVLAK